MNKFNRVSATVLAGVALYAASGASHGLGFGRPTSRAILGETLSVTVPINVDASNDFANDCVAADVYFGDDKLPGEDVTAVLMPGAGSGRVIRVTTRKFVNEPVVTLYVIAGCNAKISRKFVAFADPPGALLPSQGLTQAEAPVVAYSATPGTVRVGGLSIDTGSSALASATMGNSDASAAPVARAKKAEIQTRVAASKVKSGSSEDVLRGAPSLALSPRAQAQDARISDESALAKRQGSAAASGQTQSVQPKPASGERLMLDPVDADAFIQPKLTMTAALQGKFEGDDASPEVRERRAAAAALWLAMNATPEQLARDQVRVQELEKRLASLKQESAQSQQQIAQLQSRVDKAESIQSNPKVAYLLGGLAALLAAAVAFLYLKGRRSSSATDWLKSEGTRPAEPVHEEPPAPGAQSAEHGLAGLVARSEFIEGRRDLSPAVSVASLSPAPSAVPAVAEPAPTFTHAPTFSSATAAAPVTAPLASSATRVLQESPRAVSVEELIDLEQQAEFFVVLGQDDAALDLLESHVQSTVGASPLPFLKLLEIYQRLGKRQDYERVQADFNQHFNGYAPAWESDLLQGHSLSEYPGIVERLQALWASPSRAMDVLERSLTRPDAGAESFDLPAYRELLFLYAVARDLSEREPETRDAVDLNLPFEDPTVVNVSAELETVEPLMATRPVKSQPHAQPVLNVDLSLDDLEPLDLSPPPSPPGELEPTPANGIDFEHVVVTPPPKDQA